MVAVLQIERSTPGPLTHRQGMPVLGSCCSSAHDRAERRMAAARHGFPRIHALPDRARSPFSWLDVIPLYAVCDRLTDSSDDTIPDEGQSAANVSTIHYVPLPRGPAEHDITQLLEHRHESAATARGITRSALKNWHIRDDVIDTAVLIVCEIVTNAIEHARPPLTLHLFREHNGQRLWMGVTDGGSAPHHGSWTTSCTNDEHGRGLTIISALATAHGTHTHPGGTTHWARLLLKESESSGHRTT
ncbi:ATP-binding protein [Streptomyces sp. NPDC002306]